MIRYLILCAVLLAGFAHAEEPASMNRLQEDFLKWKFGMFIHFNLATYHELEWVNYLINVAPDKTGLIPDYSLKRLREVGELMAEESWQPTDATNTLEKKSNQPDAGDGK